MHPLDVIEMTREKILLAAKELFEEKGFDITGVREIASKAGVNPALINYHFGSKENLFILLMEEAMEQSRLKVTSISSSDATSEEKLTAIIELYVEKIFKNCRFHQSWHRELSMLQHPELTEAITKILNKNALEILKILEEGQRRKVFRKNADTQLAIGTMFGLMYQVTHPIFKNRYTQPGEDETAFKARIKKSLYEILTSYLLKS